jgi:hypothetical protein
MVDMPRTGGAAIADRPPKLATDVLKGPEAAVRHPA